VKQRIASLATVVMGVIVGCSRPADLAYSPSSQAQKLKPEIQKQVVSILREHCGTPQAPRLLGSPEVSTAHLKQGAGVYERYCLACHGATGDGNGVAAEYLIPKPRDYRRGIFKFTSTTYGSKPLREDLIRTVRRGIRGTSMPAFNLLAPRDLEAVVDYVLVLTHRGELEAELAEEAEVSEAIEPGRVPEMVAAVLNRWATARGQVVYPATPMPAFTTALVDQGKKAFLGMACIQCHGEDGRGQLATNVGVDAWGNPTKAADLTSGMLRGGTDPLDIYRHIDAGINGTPMPSFHNSVQAEPEKVWHLVAYVLHVADSRRTGQIPEAGLLENGIFKPLPGVVPATVSSAARRPDSLAALTGPPAGPGRRD
jgi:mono/diheme cytochrome c family protein